MTPAQFKVARAALDVSQVALATALGIHPVTVQCYESGKLTVPQAIVLAMQALRAAQPPEPRRRALGPSIGRRPS